MKPPRRFKSGIDPGFSRSNRSLTRLLCGLAFTNLRDFMQIFASPHKFGLKQTRHFAFGTVWILAEFLSELPCGFGWTFGYRPHRELTKKSRGVKKIGLDLESGGSSRRGLTKLAKRLFISCFWLFKILCGGLTNTFGCANDSSDHRFGDVFLHPTRMEYRSVRNGSRKVIQVSVIVI